MRDKRNKDTRDIMRENKKGGAEQRVSVRKEGRSQSRGKGKKKG